MRIAIREARDRALQRRPIAIGNGDRLPASAPGPATSTDDDPARSVELSERAARVRAAVNDLPAHYRDAVRMRYLEERSFEEIAAATGRPEPTVRTHLHRGLARMRARLTDEARP